MIKYLVFFFHKSGEEQYMRSRRENSTFNESESTIGFEWWARGTCANSRGAFQKFFFCFNHIKANIMSPCSRQYYNNMLSNKRTPVKI